MERAARRLVFLSMLGALGGCQALAGLSDRHLATQASDDGDDGDDGGAGAAGTAGGSAPLKGGKGGAAPVAGSGGAAGTIAAAGGGAGGSAGGGGDGQVHAVPPPRPTTDVKGVTHYYAAHKFYFGDVDPTTNELSSTAWSKIGFDMDGLCSTSDASTLACSPPAAGEDGLDGTLCRDNVFGKKIAPQLSFFQPNFADRFDSAIDGGAQTLLLEVSDMGSAPDDAAVPGKMFITSTQDLEPDAGGTPSQIGQLSWSGSDTRYVDVRGVTDPTNSESAELQFPNAYMANDTWVSDDHSLQFSQVLLPFGGALIPIHVLAFRMTVRLDSLHKATAGDSNGIVDSILEFVVDTKDFADAIAANAQVLFCTQPPPGAVEVVLVPQADLYVDPASLSSGGAGGFVTSGPAPSIVDPTRAKTCNAMTIAFAVQWAPIAGIFSPPRVSPPVDPGIGCHVAGAGGGGGAGAGGMTTVQGGAAGAAGALAGGTGGRG